MDAFSRKNRDAVMRIICDFYAKGEPEHYIGLDWLRSHGLPKNVDERHLVDVLQAMGYIVCKEDVEGEIYRILLTNEGKCYFEKKADITHEKRVENIRYIITTIIAVIALFKSFLPEILEFLAQILRKA